jgi:hypothetical protein
MLRTVSYVQLHGPIHVPEGGIGQVKQQLGTVPGPGDLGKPHGNVKSLSMTYDGENLQILINKTVQVFVPKSNIMSGVYSDEVKKEK